VEWAYHRSDAAERYLVEVVGAVAQADADVELVGALDVAGGEGGGDGVGEGLAAPGGVVDDGLGVDGVRGVSDGDAHVAFAHDDPAVAFGAVELVRAHFGVADQRDLQGFEIELVSVRAEFLE
jgi:hypothetical protein